VTSTSEEQATSGQQDMRSPQEEPPTTGYRSLSEVGAAAEASTQYQVVVYTGDVQGAGTDGDVWLWVDGTFGRSGWLYLDNSEDNFERNKTDYFYFTLANLGTLSAAWIYFRPAGGWPDWLLNTVTVNGTTFSWYKWLTREGMIRLQNT
jgi:hypothetical protein